nr:response regulator [Anaerolineae bacterium]
MQSPGLAGLRVLVVDDEPDSVEIVRLVLEHAGASVIQAGNGEQALAAFHEARPDLVLSDLSMPTMDGWEFLRIIREHNPAHHTLVVAMTAHAMAGDREKVMQAGFDGYLSKPLNLFTLEGYLLGLLNTGS